MSGKRFVTAVFVVLAIGMLACAASLLVFLSLSAATTPETPPEAPTPQAPAIAPAEPKQKEEWPRRYPVAGRVGYHVVIEKDGSSVLETPEGVRTKLSEAEARLPEPKPEPERKLPARPPGQLVVCERGVVDVPQGAVITLVADDKVVTHEPDGTSVTYFVDGRVVRRDRLRGTPSNAP